MVITADTYTSSHKMKDLIRDNSSLLMVMSRFGISLGFGDKTVKEICSSHNVDTATFLTVANFISGKQYNTEDISLSALMNYLKQAHDYFLEFNLPSIRRKLIEAIDCSNNDDISFLIVKFYDEYVSEVRRHMEYENKTVFIYVEKLIGGTLSDKYSIDMFSSKHNHMESKLNELQNLIIRYYSKQNSNLLNSVLFDIINCEDDLASHCDVEDELFVPAVRKLELTVNTVSDGNDTEEEIEENPHEKKEILSQREKDILICVAKGMTNKEIAETLFLSVHTVTKHRYNITSKLQIHTPAGLTVYAIMNNLINLKDIKTL